MTNRIFCIHDYDENKKKLGAFEIEKKDIKKFNKDGFGIFHTVNEFDGARKIANCTKINYWLADLDDGTKEEMLETIYKLPLKPTIVIETKKGVHCYWKAVNASIENYKAIEEGLIKRLNADKACKDPSRLLRYPMTYHLKDPKDPFYICVLDYNENKYTEEQMLFTYELPKPKAKKIEYKGNKEDMIKEENWDKIFGLDRIRNGGRNNNFSRIAFWLKDEGFAPNIIIDVINNMNAKISEPLPQWEIDLLLRSKI